MREFADGARERTTPPETPLATPAEVDMSDAKLDTMPRIEVGRALSPEPRERPAIKRIVIGLVVALAYGGILAAAGLFISRAVNSVSDHTPSSATIAGAGKSASDRFDDATQAALGERRATAAIPMPVPPPAPIAPPVAAPVVAPAEPLPPPAPPRAEMPASSAMQVVPAPSATATVTTAESPREVAAKPVTTAKTPLAAPLPEMPSRDLVLAAPLAPLPAIVAPPAPAPALAAPTAEAVPAPPTETKPPAVAPTRAERSRDTIAEAKPPALAAVPESAAPAPTVPSPAVAPKSATLEAPPAPVVTVEAPRPPTVASREAQEMRALGDQRLKQGDVATARLFYERAADGGDGPAALRLGNTLDPNYLSHWGVLGLQPDVAAAAKWYRRARDLGEAAADLDLAALPQQ